ncbi:MAG: hypothetical protein K0S41_4094 [Anaerocolumna sp.]|jgi:ADP-glucose pyrophosphorylase|nr:hypothetical protein [Anaerocolumna sp.]
MINPAKLLKIKSSWDVFTKNHPKLPNYFNAIKSSALEEGTIIEMNVVTTDGKSLKSNIKLTKSDIELLREISN